MADAIIDGTGQGHQAKVDSYNRLLVSNTTSNPVEGYNPAIELVYMASGTLTGVTGSDIGSIIYHTSTGSNVQVLTYVDGNIINVGSIV